MSALRQRKSNHFCLYLIAFCLFIWLTVTSSVCAEASPTPESVESVDTLREMQEQINQQRSNLSKERDRLSNVEQSFQDKLKGIQGNIQSTETASKDYESLIKQANQYLKQLLVNFDKAQSNYYQKQAATVARLRFLQRQQIKGFGWELLLKSQNLNELLDRRRQVKLIYQADQQSLISLKSEYDRIKQQKSKIEEVKNQISLLNQQLFLQKAQFQEQLTAQQQLITRLNTDKQALKAAQQQLALDSRSIGILIKKQLAANSPSLPNNGIFGTGQLISPSDASITSNFGWRMHPVLGDSRFHSGIDFGDDYGSTIRAADNGVVIFAGWYGGYGNAVIINHGEGITTLYAHTSKLYVSEGQNVQVGEAIAAVGSTGLSTGPHLHFEVRKDGEPVDPMDYL